MYRRNISHFLYPAAGLLCLFIAYETWLKPVYVHSPTQLEGDAPVQQKEAIPESPQDESQEPAPKQNRIIDPSNIPSTKYQEGLAAVRDEIEKGNLKEAEIRLTTLPAGIQSDHQVSAYVAILWNNLGIEQEKREGTRASVKFFKKAAALDTKNPVIQMNLAHAYWEQRDPAMTQEFLERLITLAPDDPFPHLALADLLREQNRTDVASHHLDQAIQRAGNDPAVQSYLRAVSTKLRRADQAEGRLSSRDSEHFVVKYDGEADHDTWMAALDILEEAYREVGQKFGHFPSKSIVVVLHANDTFQSATGSPAWTDGLFDPVLGRIQVPTQGALTDQAWLKRVLRHEFVHALLYDLLGVEHVGLPTWLNEGLAMQLSGDHWPEIEQLARQDVPLVPLTTLERDWGGLSSDAATVAYLESNSAVRYLINRYGMYEVQLLLARVKKKQTLSTAMQSQLSVSYDQFQSRWMDQAREGRKG